MQNSTCKFLLGLGVGSLLGMVAYRCSKSEKAKLWKHKMCCAAQSAGVKAGEWMTGVKEKASEMGQQMAEQAEDVAEDAKSKFKSYAGK